MKLMLDWHELILMFKPIFNRSNEWMNRTHLMVDDGASISLFWFISLLSSYFMVLVCLCFHLACCLLIVKLTVRQTLTYTASIFHLGFWIVLPVLSETTTRSHHSWVELMLKRVQLVLIVCSLYTTYNSVKICC